MVVPSKRTLDFLGFSDGYFVGDGVALHNLDGVAEQLVAIFYRHVFDEDGVG